VFLLLVVTTIAFIALWLVAIHAMPFGFRIFLARRPWLFLTIHVPVMYGTTFIGGAGLIVAVGSLLGGVFGQLYLSAWGMRHGLTFMGKRTPKYHILHPKRVRTSRIKSLDIAVSKRVAKYAKAR
jgi:hypothetical protein